MKALDKKCNIIPIIAKSDTVSKSELDTFKANVSVITLVFYSYWYHVSTFDRDSLLVKLNILYTIHLIHTAYYTHV